MEDRPRKQRGARQEKAASRWQPPLVKALSHSTRIEALSILTERVASPREIADQIQVRVQTVSYHIKVLVDVGLVELYETKPIRGVFAHFYKAVELPLNWAPLDAKSRSVLSGSELEALIRDAAKSLSAKVFDRRAGRQLTRKPLLLDKSGWLDVSKIQAEAIDGILRVQAEAKERIGASDTDAAIPAIVAMLLFEMPPRTGKGSEDGEP